MTQVLPPRTVDAALRARAGAVIPGGMYGHMNAAGLHGRLPAVLRPRRGLPGVGRRRQRVPRLHVRLGARRARPPAPRRRGGRRARSWTPATASTAPSPVMVELAELLVEHRPARRLGDVLQERHRRHDGLRDDRPRGHRHGARCSSRSGAYHGAAPWCTPRPSGVHARGPRAPGPLRVQRRRQRSRPRSPRRGDDLAGDHRLAVPPRRSPATRSWPTAEFARGVRAACDRAGAALILDDVRCGLPPRPRRAAGSRWACGPTSSAWSKAIANGHSLAAVTGREPLRAAASDASTSPAPSGTRRCPWRRRSPRSPSCATPTRMARMARSGQRLRDGLAAQAAAHGFAITPDRPGADAAAAVRGDDAPPRWRGCGPTRP